MSDAAAVDMTRVTPDELALALARVEHGAITAEDWKYGEWRDSRAKWAFVEDATHALWELENGRRVHGYCWSRGPRIGDDGTPVCFRPEGHRGNHHSHPDSGFNESWGDPPMIIPEHERERFWRPEWSTGDDD